MNRLELLDTTSVRMASFMVLLVGVILATDRANQAFAQMSLPSWAGGGSDNTPSLPDPGQVIGDGRDWLDQRIGQPFDQHIGGPLKNQVDRMTGGRIGGGGMILPGGGSYQSPMSQAQAIMGALRKNPLVQGRLEERARLENELRRTNQEWKQLLNRTPEQVRQDVDRQFDKIFGPSVPSIGSGWMNKLPQPNTTAQLFRNDYDTFISGRFSF